MLRTLLGPIVAVIQLFALYVLMHGHYSPGGGFQAGVLLACSLILPMLVHGQQTRQSGFPALTQEQAVALAAVGVLIYAAIGVLSMKMGYASMLDYDDLPLPGMAADRRSLGILGIEIGVTLGVAGAVVAIFRALQDQEGDVETLA